MKGFNTFFKNSLFGDWREVCRPKEKGVRSVEFKSYEHFIIKQMGVEDYQQP